MSDLSLWILAGFMARTEILRPKDDFDTAQDKQKWTSIKNMSTEATSIHIYIMFLLLVKQVWRQFTVYWCSHPILMFTAVMHYVSC